MNFLEEVSALNSPSVSATCKVKVFVANQDLVALKKNNQDPVTIEEIALARETNTLKAIHRALTNRGFTFSEKTLAAHLKGDCHCYRTKAD